MYYIFYIISISGLIIVVQAPTPQGPQAANALGRFGGSNLSVPMGQAPPGMGNMQSRGTVNVNTNNPNVRMGQNGPSSSMNISGTTPPPGLGNQSNMQMGPGRSIGKYEYFNSFLLLQRNSHGFNRST
jgi:hypothetical protein